MKYNELNNYLVNLWWRFALSVCRGGGSLEAAQGLAARDRRCVLAGLGLSGLDPVN